MSVPPRVALVAGRFATLIEEGHTVAALERPSGAGHEWIRDHVAVQAWLAKVINIVVATFGSQSVQERHLQGLLPDGPRLVEHAYQVKAIVGLLVGARDDLMSGFLTHQEFLIAADVFDDVIQQATGLNQAGYKDPAAVLGRVVLEGALRRLAGREGIPTSAKCGTLNDELKRVGAYAQPQWRMIQAWLDIGNAGAHGEFGAYTREQVDDMLVGVAKFLAAHLAAR